MSNQEVYKSSTLGPIPLSFTGRHLLQTLREAVTELVSKVEEAGLKGCAYTPARDRWEPVSLARGKLAQYMSQLEKRNVPQSMLDELARLRHENEVLSKANEAHKAQEQRRKRVVNVADPLIYFGSTRRPIHPFWQSPKNEYFVRVIEGNFQANKRHERKPGSIITTEVQIGGSMQVTAFTSDEALDMAVEQAHKHGFTELTKKDFEVRYLGPAEA